MFTLITEQFNIPKTNFLLYCLTDQNKANTYEFTECCDPGVDMSYLTCITEAALKVNN